MKIGNPSTRIPTQTLASVFHSPNFRELKVIILRQSRRLYGCWPLKGAGSQPTKVKTSNCKPRIWTWVSYAKGTYFR